MKAPEAGNNANTLRGTDRDEVANTGLPSAADLDEVAKEAEIAAVTGVILDADPELREEIVAEREANLAADTVSREEFDALEARVAEIEARIEKHNAGAPHKI